ncbi:MAG: class I SAM-dependent methyltransferase [Gammaproteobacteria bacterium]|jgi:demethylmenaquinone methyltransferase/2-methoxy-6-polyprenyl-1,4-benzoquinol methylase|nr:class I SAM-dependent methyltransferase [Gammaproteobacteria bacterium]
MNKELQDEINPETRLVDYYARRAPEYERIYHRPERQEDLRKLEQLVAQAFRNLDVLEIACGTGYWTQFIAKQARSILATDCNREVIDIARHKDYTPCTVSFVESDAYSLTNIEVSRLAGFSGFWWSHIAKAKLHKFINALHSKLDDRALVLLIDNRYVEGNSLPISRHDGEGNTYQMRRLADGSEYEVRKNFPTKTELTERLTPYAHDLKIEFLTYYWLARYRVTSRE